ncbi:MAG: helix-turn-helix transcriptional regulator [Lachnospiraceae bacterium]|nr:helix-turn-helix transcriptional regulator [Lachnospiraceae bacterium]
MTEDAILEKIRFLMNQKGYSENRLASECGITQSTINSMFKNNNLPSLPTLLKICNGLGITMSQFFQDDSDSPLNLSPSQLQLLNEWNNLSIENQKIILDIILILKARQS